MLSIILKISDADKPVEYINDILNSDTVNTDAENAIYENFTLLLVEDIILAKVYFDYSEKQKEKAISSNRQFTL